MPAGTRKVKAAHSTDGMGSANSDQAVFESVREDRLRHGSLLEYKRVEAGSSADHGRGGETVRT